MSTTFISLIKNIWAHIDGGQKFFVVVEGDDHFFIADPDDIEQGAWADGQKESGVMVFTSPGSASHYREYLIEQHEIQPSTLKVASIDLSRVYALMPKIKAYAKKKYGGPVRLQAVAYHGEFAFTEILYSDIIPKH